MLLVVSYHWEKLWLHGPCGLTASLSEMIREIITTCCTSCIYIIVNATFTLVYNHGSFFVGSAL